MTRRIYFAYETEGPFVTRLVFYPSQELLDVGIEAAKAASRPLRSDNMSHGVAEALNKKARTLTADGRILFTSAYTIRAGVLKAAYESFKISYPLS